MAIWDYLTGSNFVESPNACIEMLKWMPDAQEMDRITRLQILDSQIKLGKT